MPEIEVICPECDEILTIDGNEEEITCHECGFKGGQADFPDADEE